MAFSKKSDASEWRLGVEPAEPLPVAQPAAQPPSPLDLSRQRLTHPVQTITVEHLAWLATAVWLLVTRFVMLGARPLDNREAAHALYEFAVGQAASSVAMGYHPAYAGWVHMLEAGFFAGLGANDLTARIAFALCGVLLVGISFAMRPVLGRAGALGLAAMLAVSPSVTWFSRANATVTPALAFTLVTVALFMALIRRPRFGFAAALGVALGLMVSADRTSFVTLAIFTASLGLIGLELLLRTDHPWLRIRVWWRRRVLLVLTAGIAAAIVWFLSEFALAPRIQQFGIANLIRAFWYAPPQTSGYMQGLNFFAPPLALYEFLIAICAILGAIIIVTARVRSRFAVWCLLWAVLSIAFYLWTPARQSGWILQMLIPMALVGAVSIDYLHHTHAWTVLRYIFAGFLLFTIYLQINANFVHYAPAETQASWDDHLSLYSRAATTQQTPPQCAAAVKGLTAADATVFFPPWTPASLRWYLRGLRPVAQAKNATVIVKSLASEDDGLGTAHSFDYEMGWTPAFFGLDLQSALAYLANSRVWGTVYSRNITLVVRSIPSSGPTVIYAP